jgi:hypothetical protein
MQVQKKKDARGGSVEDTEGVMPLSIQEFEGIVDAMEWEVFS